MGRHLDGRVGHGLISDLTDHQHPCLPGQLGAVVHILAGDRSAPLVAWEALAWGRHVSTWERLKGVALRCSSKVGVERQNPESALVGVTRQIPAADDGQVHTNSATSVDQVRARHAFEHAAREAYVPIRQA